MKQFSKAAKILPTAPSKEKHSTCREISITSKQAVILVSTCTECIVIVSVTSFEKIFNLLNFLHAVHVSAYTDNSTWKISVVWKTTHAWSRLWDIYRGILNCLMLFGDCFVAGFFFFFFSFSFHNL